MEIAVSSKKNKGNEDDEHRNIEQWLGDPLQQENINDGNDDGDSGHDGDGLPAVLELVEILSKVALLVNLLVDLVESLLDILAGWEAISEF